MLGRLMGWYVELRLEDESKCPERFSRRVDCIARPESLRLSGVNGKGGADPDVGELGGELYLLVELVDGL